MMRTGICQLQRHDPGRDPGEHRRQREPGIRHFLRAHHVLFLVSLNKVCSSLETALDRAENTAAAVCAQKFDIQTPCRTTGFCSHCKAPETRCCEILITRYARHPERIHVILVNDQLGF